MVFSEKHCGTESVLPSSANVSDVADHLRCSVSPGDGDAVGLPVLITAVRFLPHGVVTVVQHHAQGSHLRACDSETEFQAERALLDEVGAEQPRHGTFPPVTPQHTAGPLALPS